MSQLVQKQSKTNIRSSAKLEFQTGVNFYQRVSTQQLAMGDRIGY